MLNRFGGSANRLSSRLVPSCNSSINNNCSYGSSLVRYFAYERRGVAAATPNVLSGIGDEKYGMEVGGGLVDEDEEEEFGAIQESETKNEVGGGKPIAPFEDDDPASPHLFRIEQELERPQYSGDYLQADRDELRAELAFRQRNLTELDQIISEDWVLNQSNGVYYNPTTGETKVPLEQSYEAFKARRARRMLDEKVAHSNQAFPDFISKDYVLKEAQFYPEPEMRAIRARYKNLDYKELNKVLSEADHRFFKKEPTWSLMKWGVNRPYIEHNSEAKEKYELEHMKFLSLLPYKYHVKTFRVGHMTATGRKTGVGVLVIGGTGNGYVGYGYGRSSNPGDALTKASHELRRNMLEVPLDEGRTIPFSVVGKYRTTKVIMQRCTRGRGIRGGHLMQAICECTGLTDLSSKITGSRLKNPMSIVQAIFQGLARLVSPRQLAHWRGVNYYTEYGGPIREPAPTNDEMKRRTSKILDYIKDAEQQWSLRSDLNHMTEGAGRESEGDDHRELRTAPEEEEGGEPKKKRRLRTEEAHKKYYPWTLPKRTNPTRPRPRPGRFQGPELVRERQYD